MIGGVCRGRKMVTLEQKGGERPPKPMRTCKSPSKGLFRLRLGLKTLATVLLTKKKSGQLNPHTLKLFPTWGYGN